MGYGGVAENSQHQNGIKVSIMVFEENRGIKTKDNRELELNHKGENFSAKKVDRAKNVEVLKPFP